MAKGKHRVKQGQAFVVSLGSFSTALLASLGVKLVTYPGKGDAATCHLTDAEAPRMVR